MKRWLWILLTATPWVMAQPPSMHQMLEACQWFQGDISSESLFQKLQSHSGLGDLTFQEQGGVDVYDEARAVVRMTRLTDRCKSYELLSSDYEIAEPLPPVFEPDAEPVTSDGVTTYRIKEMSFYRKKGESLLKPLGHDLMILTFKPKASGEMTVNGMNQAQTAQYIESLDSDDEEELQAQALAYEQLMREKMKSQDEKQDV